MARYTYTVLSTAKPGQEDEYIKWYTEQHLADVANYPEVVSAKLFRLDFHRVYDLDAPKWTCMTIYELECDDPEATVNRMRDASGSPGMPMTDTLTKVGMVQVIGHQIGEA